MEINQDRSERTQDDSLSPTHSVIAQLWCEVLQIAHTPGCDDDFFSLGGDSMTMVMLEFRITEELEVTLPMGALLGAPTLRELSALIDAQRPVAHPSERKPWTPLASR